MSTKPSRRSLDLLATLTGTSVCTLDALATSRAACPIRLSPLAEMKAAVHLIVR